MERRAGKGWRGRWGVPMGALLLGLAMFGVFGGTARHGWVAWDDDGYIYANETVRNGLTWKGIWWAWTTGEQANWHPLTWMSLMADWELFGDWPGGGHLESVALHWVNAILLWWVLARMGGGCRTAWWAALLWAVHPLRAESVAWASERKDVLSALFGLAAVGCYLGGRRVDETTRRQDEGRGARRMWKVAGWMVASLLCKPTMVTLPCLLLLLDGWPLRRWKHGEGWKLVREKWMLWGVAVASSTVTLIVQKEAMSSLASIGWGERVATALCGYGWYLKKWACPAGLAFFYPRATSGVSGWGAAGWGAALAVATAGAVGALRKRGWGWVGVGWFWFLGSLVPMIGLVQVGVQAWADRYSYWPEMGLWTAAAGAWAVAGRRLAIRREAGILALGWAVALGWAAREQAATWKSNESLFGRALAVTTGNAPAEGNWGTELGRAGRWAEARPHLERAVRLWPGKGNWWHQLGTVRHETGDSEGAKEAWRNAVLVDAEQWEAMNNLAWVLLEEGRVEEAREWIDRAMEHEEARASEGARDTEAAVKRAEQKDAN